MLHAVTRLDNQNLDFSRSYVIFQLSHLSNTIARTNKMAFPRKLLNRYQVSSANT